MASRMSSIGSSSGGGTIIPFNTDPAAGEQYSSYSLHHLNNRHNFEKSALPSRILFFSNGDWTDFSGAPFETMQQGFAARHPAVEVDLADGGRHLIDFLRMLRIDLASGTQSSIAWIDASGRCFFPLNVEAPEMLPAPRRRPGRPPKVPRKDGGGGGGGYGNAVNVQGGGSSSSSGSGSGSFTPRASIFQPVVLGRSPAAGGVSSGAAAASKAAMRINMNPYHRETRM
ncbi:hypothetical protein H6P81_009260 [Aristolochia fimbriata]|uniref:RCD1 WWE domain-containing protein n=1 Tax=Aristolochia fimbriata TaxID=158543 RepID=A0AAV7EKD2_ARIFI|nr:hypothetical protein H6P81_009260 [Aristolochia fimbriata]